MTINKKGRKRKKTYGPEPNLNPADWVKMWSILKFATITPKRRSIIESLKTLKKELAKIYFNDTLDGIIQSISYEEDSEKFKILEAFVENLKIVHERGARDATREILSAIFRFLEIKKHEDGRLRTANATEAHMERALLRSENIQSSFFHSKVYPFFHEVEDEWHPKVEQQKQPRSRGRISKRAALSRIYLKHQEEIDKAAEESGESQETAFRMFCRMFDLYTKRTTTKNNGLTANGYKKETRAARSEASKQKARETANNNVIRKM